MTSISRFSRGPWIWALIYVVMIPLFALWYAQLPRGSFYLPNAQRDPGVVRLHNELLEDIRQQILANVTAHYGSLQVVHEGWTIDTHHFLQLYEIRAEAGHVLAVDMAAWATPVDGPGFSWEPAWLRIPLSFWIGEGEDCRFYPTIEGDPHFRVPLPLLFPGSPLPERTMPATTVVFPVTQELEEKMHQFYRARTGFSEDAPGRFRRMLYLSAVTITTLGYGDVVPTSPRARDLIAMEAIAGVAVLGLFISRVAQTIGANRRGASPDRPPPNIL